MPDVVTLDHSPEALATRRTWVATAAVYLSTIAVYSRALSFAFVSYDDYKYVVDNVHIHRGLTSATFKWATSAIFFSNYSPLTLLSYLSVSSLLGVGPAGFHTLNIIVHAGVVSLAFLFLVKTGANMWVSLVAAAAWGWHPLRVESVAWVSELKDVLCGLFCLLTLLAYLGYVNRKNIATYLLTLLAYAAALASKPMAISLPILLLLLDYFPFGRFQQHSSRKKAIFVALSEKLPMFALGFGLSRLTLIAQASTTQPFPLHVRLANAVISVGAYLLDTLIPRRLAVFYPHFYILGRSTPVVQVVFCSAVLIAISVITILLAFRKRPAALVGWMWFGISLVPVVGLVQVGEQARADRYTYLPTLGLFFATAWVVSRFMSERRPSASVWYCVGGGAVAVVVVEVTLLQFQLGYWKNSDTLFEHALQVTDSNYLACSELANVRMHDHREVEALNWADRALAIRPNDKYSITTRGLALVHLERYTESLKAFRTAIIMDPKDPLLRRYAANVLVLLKRNDQAELQLKRSLQLNGDDPATHDDYAALLAGQGRMPEAVSQWQKAIAIDPSFANAHAGLAQAAELTGDTSAAERGYRYAVQFAGANAKPQWLLNLAWLEATLPASSPADVDDAVAKAMKAIPDPDRATPLEFDTLAAALARNGQFNEAVKFARRGVNKAYDEKNRPMGDAILHRLNGYLQGQPYIAGSTHAESR